jgi:hypothetical protein
MNIEGEIHKLRDEVEMMNSELEEVGILLNSRGELSKVLTFLLEMKKDIEELKNKPEYLIKIWRKK